MINWPVCALLVVASFVIAFAAKQKMGRKGHAAASSVLLVGILLFTWFFMPDKVLGMFYIPMVSFGCLLAELPLKANKARGR